MTAHAALSEKSSPSEIFPQQTPMSTDVLPSSISSSKSDLIDLNF